MSAAVEAAKAGASRGTECWPNRSASQAHQARSGFAEQALATIETASRRAAAELDDMLSLLRYETRSPAAPGLGGCA